MEGSQLRPNVVRDKDPDVDEVASQGTFCCSCVKEDCTFFFFMPCALEASDGHQNAFFCWKLLGLIPGGTPFSQLNKGVRDAMSATTKRDV